MATCTSVCAVCDIRHQTSTSTHWCVECEEPLCSDCKDHHNVFKATRNHKIISISDHQLLPSAVTNIKQNCVYHNKKYQLYCMYHESPICNKCVKDHGKCGEVLSLEEVIREIKTSESFFDLENGLDDLYDNTNQISTDRKSNLESITDQKEKITAQVCRLKQQVIQHVNKLEEEFLKELDQIELKYCNPIRSSVASLQDRAKEINHLKSEIKNTKKYASNLQTFLNMKKIQTKTTEYEKDLQFSNDNECNETIKIRSTIDTTIQDILNVDRFGSINVKKGPSPNMDIQRRKDRQAQVMVPQPIKLINEIKLEFKQKIDTVCACCDTFDNYFGCCVTTKDEFLLTNCRYSVKNIITVNTEGRVKYTIPLKNCNEAFDVACINDSTLALSSFSFKSQGGISIVDLTERKVVKFIDLPESTYGITYDGKSLICCVRGKDMHVISCTDYSITTIPNTVSSEMSYVSSHADKIFFTNPDDHTVKCCLYSGVLVWEFKDESILDCPQGITADNNGNVFVAGEKSSMVLVLSPDGKQCIEILDEEDDIFQPTAICFAKQRNQLLLINRQRQACKCISARYVT
ncbi:uncharacterized protein LOC134684840 [Mytilus trossulus]|uniref:uncharacterized protein LOC134684840 n=1 Tax=Mytilus trossulus TaxID=6551 RepID=UPI00300422A4